MVERYESKYASVTHANMIEQTFGLCMLHIHLTVVGKLGKRKII